jgi:recombination protein RecT
MCELLKKEEAIQKIKCALGSDDIQTKRYIMMARLEISKNEGLQRCTPTSILSCIVEAASRKLDIGTGDVYLVPFRNRKEGTSICSFFLGYQGMIKIMYRSGIDSLSSYIFYEKDVFKCELGTSLKITHVPAFKDRGDMLGVYGIATIGERNFIQIMTKDEIDYIKNLSPTSSYPDSPWNLFYQEMAQVKIFRKLYKALPKEKIGENILQAQVDEFIPTEVEPNLKNEDFEKEKSKNIESKENTKIIEKLIKLNSQELAA